MASPTQSFEHLGGDGDDNFFNIPENVLNWFSVPPPNPPQVRSIHEWQEKYTREVQVAVAFSNRNTNNNWSPMKVGPKGYAFLFSIVGGTCYPRFVLKLALHHPKGPQFNVTLRAVFPIYGDDGLNYARDPLPVIQAQPLRGSTNNPLNPDGSWMLSNAMMNLKYGRYIVDQQGTAQTGIKVGSEVEKISWSTEIGPITTRFNDNLAAAGFTNEQVNIATNFCKIKAPETKVDIRTAKVANLDMQYRLIIALPSPVPPPFPTIDARYNSGLKCLKPIHIKNIPNVFNTPIKHLNHFALRKNGWNQQNNFPNSLITASDERALIPMPYDCRFDSTRHYEAVQMLGLAREVQAQQPDAANMFNRQYGFVLVPVPNSFDNSEFLIFLNVRPTRRDLFDTQMAPPEPGCKVKITIQQGQLPRPASPEGPLLGSRSASNASQTSYARPGGQSSPDLRSRALSIASQRSILGQASGTAPPSTPVRSHTRNTSGVSVRGSPASRPGTPPHWNIPSPQNPTSPFGSPGPNSPQGLHHTAGLDMPNISSLIVSSDTNTPGNVDTWHGPTIARSADSVEWDGLVVPNPEKRVDEFEICIYLRVPSAANPLGGMVTGSRHGDFRFGNPNAGVHAQAEQAIRLAMHGDMSYYGIPRQNWMQALLFARENRSLEQQGRGPTPKDGARIPDSLKNKLTAKQKEALEAAISNNTVNSNQLNHYVVFVKGPPATGKSTVSQCIACHCYNFGEKLLIACGTNRALTHLANKILEVLPKSNKSWLVENSVPGVYRLETDFDESFQQIDRNAHAYQHECQGENEPRVHNPEVRNLRGTAISEAEFQYVEQYVKRRVLTGRPLSLGDHILERLRKARAQPAQSVWTFEDYSEEESKKEFDLLWDFIALRQAAARHQVFFVELVGESEPQRQARFEDLDNVQKNIVNETGKAWRNLQSFYIKNAKVVLVTAQTAGRRILKSYRADRVIIEEAGQLDEPNSLNAFVRSYSTLKKVIWTGDPDQLPPTTLSYSLNEASLYRAKSQMERLVESGVEVIELDKQFRMHPHIANFISREFYGNRVTNGPAVATRSGTTTFRNWVRDYAARNDQNIHNPANSLFISVRGADVYRRKQATSLCNPAYIERTHDVVMDLLRFITSELNLTNIQQLRGRMNIAVACYYTEELSLLKKWLYQIENLVGMVEVVTIDSTQGWEFDVVILSTTRPGGQFGLGFVADRKRQNVGLSRAKIGHVTIGHKNMGDPISDKPGYKGSKGGHGFSAWERYWKYHFEELKCYIEVPGHFAKAAQALNVNPDNYEVATDKRATPA